jgi:5-methylcytosine-specific restriction endonuclease McrA
MGSKKKVSGRSGESKINRDEMTDIVRRARQAEEERMKGYREQSLRIHPWVCARCGREFTRKNLHMLTVHHRDHNHNNNPSDGSNWENLCIYCHDNEHSRYIDHMAAGDIKFQDVKSDSVTHKPFAGLEEMLKKK